MNVLIALQTVAMMLIYAIPGYLLIKGKKITEKEIQNFAVLLLYVCTPFQMIYSLQQIEKSPEMTRNLGIVTAVAFVTICGVLAIVYFILRKKQNDPKYRICTMASIYGNCGFAGIPLLQAVLADHPEAVAYATGFFFVQNLITWSICSFIITRDKSYIRPKKVFINPAMLGMYVAFILYFADIKVTGMLWDATTMLSRMATPLCMIILGMRLAAIPIKPMFTSALQYATIFFRQVICPIIALLVCKLCGLDTIMTASIYILTAVPVGTSVLTFSEILGEGQNTAANVVLLSTILSIAGVPLMMLLIA
ncbi:MAG: AEC family transporter [Clostridia bacterium]|nr:AEC family transporter [Clostridia bacterium]